MTEENAALVDFWGDPWEQPRDARGRKRHRRLPEIAEKVAVLKAAGLNAEEIAARSGMSEPTLRKYYLRELQGGRTLARAALIEAVYAKAKDGNVSAARVMLQEFDRGSAAVPPPKEPPAPKPEKPGKKAAANADAEHAHEGTGWGDLLQ